MKPVLTPEQHAAVVSLMKWPASCFLRPRERMLRVLTVAKECGLLPGIVADLSCRIGIDDKLNVVLKNAACSQLGYEHEEAGKRKGAAAAPHITQSPPHQSIPTEKGAHPRKKRAPKSGKPSPRHKGKNSQR